MLTAAGSPNVEGFMHPFRTLTVRSYFRHEIRETKEEGAFRISDTQPKYQNFNKSFVPQELVSILQLRTPNRNGSEHKSLSCFCSIHLRLFI